MHNGCQANGRGAYVSQGRATDNPGARIVSNRRHASLAGYPNLWRTKPDSDCEERRYFRAPPEFARRAMWPDLMVAAGAGHRRREISARPIVAGFRRQGRSDSTGKNGLEQDHVQEHNI